MRLPWKLYRYCGREIATLFVLAWVSLTLLYVLVLGLQAVSNGLSMSVVAIWVADSIEFSFFFTVPIALLIAATLGYGRWVADREYTAVTSSGLSPLQLGVPLAVLSGVLGIGALLTQGTWLPDAHYAQRNIARFLVQQLEDLGDRRDGQLMLSRDDGVVLDYAEVRGGKHFLDVHLRARIEVEKESESEEEPPEKTRIPILLAAQFADLAIDEQAKELVLTLRGVELLINDPASEKIFQKSDQYRIWQPVRIKRHPLRFPLEAKRKREGDLHSSDLLVEASNFRSKSEETSDIEEQKYFLRKEREYRAEYWYRIALALSVFTFPLLGFPISLAFRYQHRLFGIGLGSAIVITTFYPLLFLGETLCGFGIPAPIAVLAGNGVVSLIALGFIGKLLTR